MPTPEPCPRCGDTASGRSLDPSIGLGFAALGALVLADGMRGVWTRGLASIHSVVGFALLGAALWGLATDAVALRRPERPRPTLWIEARAVCRSCSLRSSGARDLRTIRRALAVALVAFAVAVAGRTLG